MQKSHSQEDILSEQNFRSIFRQGLVHNIYLSGKFIIKIPKKQFPDFNNRNHFLLEKKCLELLRVHGIPTPSYIEVSNLLIKNTKHHCLIETFIEGKQVKWGELNTVSLSSINNVYDISHQIITNGAGLLNHFLEGSHKTWGDYIKQSICNNKNYLISLPEVNLNRKVFLFLEKNFLTLSKTKSFNKNVFLLVDFNPGNMLLGLKGNILSVIDIDHPMGGDYLFDYAPINWHHEQTFKKLQSQHLNLKGSEFFSVLYYTLIYGLNTIVWRLNHGLSCEEEFNILLKFYSETIKLSV